MPIANFPKNIVDITDDEVEYINSIAQVTSLKKNEALLREGEVCRSVAIILKGAVRVYYTDKNGHEQNVSFHFEGEPLVAYESFMNQVPSSLSAATIEPSEVMWITQSEFFDFIEKFPHFEQVFRHTLGEYMEKSGEHARYLRIESAREKYQRLCEQSPQIIKRVPLKHIASYLDMAFETLSRIRGAK